MDSRIAEAIRLSSQPVAVLYSDERPTGAVQFAEGKWGCVVAMFAAAARGEVIAFDSETHGCNMGGVGLCLRDHIVEPMGGREYFLSHGWGEGYPKDEFHPKGQGYFKTPELARRFLESLPSTSIPLRYAVLKPLGVVEPGQEQPALVAFLVDADQVSALTMLANYGRGTSDSVIVPMGAGCHTLGLYPYHEAQRERPRAVLGCTDVSARAHLDPGRFSFTVPWSMFLEMEENVPGCFLEGEAWQALLRRRQQQRRPA